MIKKSSLLKFLLCQLFLFSFTSLSYLSAQTGPNDDFDGDGIINSIDLDDDNDGILDTVENNGNGSCDTSGGVDISTLNFTPTAGNNTVVSTTSNTINATGNSWHSDYSTTTVTAPFYFEFTADASAGNMMIGVIGATQAQPTGTNSFSANSYKFNFQNAFNYQIYKYAATTVTGQLYGAGDKFSIEVNASNNIIMKRNGVVVYTDLITTGDIQFKLHISVTSGRTFSNVVWGGTNTITTTCDDTDSDNDGILNRFELDSDNDGCSDAYEAGVTTNPAFTQFPITNVGANGFENSLETSLESGTYNGFYIYQYAINGTASACVDSDGDGIRDIDDKDDDNDGVPDTLETVSNCGDGTGRTIAWDWEDEKTQSSSYSYFGNKPAFRPLAGPGIDILGSGGAWRIMNIDNDGTLSNAIALGEYQYAQFTVREKGIYVNGWEYYQINNTGSATKPKMGILIDEDPNFGSPVTLNDGIAPIQPYATITYTDGFPRSLVHASNPTYLSPNTTYYVRFYDLKTNGINDVSHDEIGLLFEGVPSGINCGGDFDTDGDNIANRLDLDSDGDGCSDRVESGVSPTTDVITPSSTNNVGISYGITNPAGAQLNPQAADINNDGINDSIDPDQNGIPNYSSSYQLYAIVAGINACTDTDGDGIVNLTDIDDDNDGVLDATESPACFYTSGEAGTIAVVSTPLPNDDGVNVNLPFMHDGVTTTVTASNNVIEINQAVNGATIYNIEYPSAIKLTSISHYGTTFGTSATAKIQGSNDKIIWDELMTAPTAATANPKIFTINNNTANSYRYYRIVKVAGTTTPLITSYEVSAVQNTTDYNPSAHPKASCTTANIDGDNIVPHLDLDTDGDGCSDSVEAGNTPFSSNNTTTFNTGTDANNNGLLDQFENGTTGTINYTSTYDQYAVFPNISACTDTDGDGIADITDIDDDNDGVLDTIESTFNPYLNTACENNLIERMGYTSVFTLSNQAADKIGLIVGTDNTFTTGFPMGASCATISFGNSSATFNTYIYFKFVNPYNTTEQVPLNYMTLTSDCSGFNEIVQYDAYDINGNFLYNQSLTTTPAYGANYCVTIQPPAGVQVYSIRVQQVLSAPILSGISLKGVSNYNDLDTDNDGIPNRLDLDSDGDGCPDAVEAGTATQAGAGNTSSGTLVNSGGSQTGVANAIVGDNTPAAYGANGFYTGIETNDTPSAAYTGAYTYNQYAIVSTLNACTDTDGDGTPDLFDIDDDNDGIVDATESPACFYTAAEANVISKITSQFTSPDDNQTDGDIQMLHDGATTLTFNFDAIATTANPTGSNLFTVEYPTSLQLATLSVSDNISTTVNANAVVVGSNDGITWSAALSPATLITATPTVFNITATQPYKYYRIQTGSTPGALAIANTIGEITSTVAASYIPSAHQKPVICSVDTDGDTIPNHLDLDSDGDGCSDLAESGVSPATDVITPSTTNNAGGSYGITSPSGSQLDPAAADTNNDGLNDSVDSDLNSITNYTSTYPNAINSAITACTLFCYKPAVTSGTVLDTHKGITSLGRAGVNNSNWPMVRKGGWIALEAKTKGFVPNRLSTAEINAIPAANLVEGMMVYNITLDCLQINTDGTAAGWKCFNTQACP